jgi:hypothetical protein
MLRWHKHCIVSLLQQDLWQRRHLQSTRVWDADDWRAYFDERAAIAEYDGRLSRSEAEARAFHCCLAEWFLHNPIESSPDRCLECGRSARANDQLLAIGVVGAGQAWLHRDCVSTWHSVRIAAAVEALKEMNIVGARASRQTSSGN